MRPKKRLGQNFLKDVNILEKIAEASGITNDDMVLEIGPGYGSLTSVLAKRAKKVLALELDRNLIEGLKKSQPENVEVIHCDALEFDFGSIKEQFKVVANPPYYISTPLLYKLIESKHRIKSATFTLQKDVANRIVATPATKSFGTITVFYQLFAESRICFDIKRHNFYPVPKVDSAVLRIVFFNEPRLPVKDINAFFKMVKGSFFLRRKMLYNSLRKSNYIKSDRDIKSELAMLGIEPTRRGETLSLEEFIRMSDHFCGFMNKNL